MISVLTNKKVATMKDIKEEFQTFIKTAINSSDNTVTNKGFLIFIDDLDRINPAMAVTLLEALKNLFDLEGCVFLIAIDYEVVSRGISMKYGTNNIENRDAAKMYFDKMIQLPFVMPISKYSVKEPLEKDLNNIGFFKDAKELDELIDVIAEIVSICTRKNPRQIKRYMNMLELAAIMDGENLKKYDSDYRLLEFLMVGMQMSFPITNEKILLNGDLNKWKKDMFVDIDAHYLKPITSVVKSQFNLNAEWKEVLYIGLSSNKIEENNISRILRLLEIYDEQFRFHDKRAEHLKKYLIPRFYVNKINYSILIYN